jgi:transcriptional regulator with XRE-family HTH domain
MDKKLIGTLLKARRKAVTPKVTLTAIHQQTGIAISHLSNIERGKVSAGLDVLAQVLGVIGVRPSEFLREAEQAETVS